MDLIKNLDAMLQIVCDPENQPHQFTGDCNGLKEAFKVKTCNCIEPPKVDDEIIIICGKCKCVLD